VAKDAFRSLTLIQHIADALLLEEFPEPTHPDHHGCYDESATQIGSKIKRFLKHCLAFPVAIGGGGRIRTNVGSLVVSVPAVKRGTKCRFDDIASNH